MDPQPGKQREGLAAGLALAACCLGPLLLIAAVSLGAAAIIFLGAAAGTVALAVGATALWKTRRNRSRRSAPAARRDEPT